MEESDKNKSELLLEDPPAQAEMHDQSMDQQNSAENQGDTDSNNEGKSKTGGLTRFFKKATGIVKDTTTKVTDSAKDGLNKTYDIMKKTAKDAEGLVKKSATMVSSSAGYKLVDKLFDANKDREKPAPLKKEDIDKIDDMIKAENSLQVQPYRFFVPCCNCRRLFCGRNSEEGLCACERIDDDENSDSGDAFDQPEKRKEEKTQASDFNVDKTFENRISDLIKKHRESKSSEKVNCKSKEAILEFRDESIKFLEKNVKVNYNDFIKELKVIKKNQMAKQKSKENSNSITEENQEEDGNAENGSPENIVDEAHPDEPDSKQQQKQKQSETEKEREGFLEYGQSIENFFNLEWLLMKAFVVLTILCLPQIYIYLWYNDVNTQESNAYLSSMSFAGLGQAENICVQGYLNNDDHSFGIQQSNLTMDVNYNCDPGYSVTNVFSSGYIDVRLAVLRALNGEILDQVCQYNEAHSDTQLNKLINQTVVEECAGQHSCQIEIDLSQIRELQLIVLKNETIVYFQASCTYLGGNDGEHMRIKRLWGLFVAVIGLYMCIFFRFFMRAIQNNLKLQDKILDHKLVTVTDYTVNGQISKSLFERIIRQTEIYETQSGTTYIKPIKRFQRYLIDVVQANLKKYNENASDKKEDEFAEEKYRIVDISYAFKNAYMLRQLIKMNTKIGQLYSCWKSLCSCCLRIYHRRRMNNKMNADDSDDSDQEFVDSDDFTENEDKQESHSDSEDQEFLGDTEEESCYASCTKRICGSNEKFDAKIDRYFFRNQNLGADETKVKEQLKKFFRKYNMVVNVEKEQEIIEIFKNPNQNSQKEQKIAIRNYISDKIRNQNFDFSGIDECEEKMNDQKEKEFVNLTTPKHFWVTFMESKAVEQLQKLGEIDLMMHPKSNMRINKKIQIDRANEPTDILWENVGVKPKKQIKYCIIASIVGLIVAFFAQMGFISEISFQQYIKYRAHPPSVNCDVLLGPLNYEQQLELAFLDYVRIEENKNQLQGVENLEGRISRLGNLPCFCTSEAAENPPEKYYNITQIVEEKTDIQLCKEQMMYSNPFGIYQILYYGVSVAMVTQSFLIRFIFVKMAEKINFQSESMYLSFVIFSSFSIFFINYGFAYIFGPLKIGIPLVNDLQITFGIYYDFNEAWFGDVGELIIINQLLYAFMPLIEDVCLVWAPHALCKFYDRKPNCCRSKNEDNLETRSQSLFEYKTVHGGPQFEIQYKYAYMITLTWVTFLFGPGIPILFPIALIGMINLYTTNQIMLAYVCKRPPTYDESMTITTIRLLKLAPLLYAMMGAWLFSNQQTFYNTVNPVPYGEVMMPTSHYMKQFVTEATPGSVFFVYILAAPALFCFTMILKQVGTCVRLCCKKENIEGEREQNEHQSASEADKINMDEEIEKAKNCNPFAMIKFCLRTRFGGGYTDDDVIEQQLPSFYETLNWHDRHSLIADEIENFNRLQVKRLTLENLLYLIFMEQSEEDTRLKGNCSYRILRQPIAESFNYQAQPSFDLKQTDFVFSPYKGKTMKKFQLDVVRATTYLAYIEPKLALDIHFNAAFIRYYHQENQPKSSTLEKVEEKNDSIRDNNTITSEANQLVRDDQTENYEKSGQDSSDEISEEITYASDDEAQNDVLQCNPLKGSIEKTE